MSYTKGMIIQLGILGTVDAEVTYDGCAGSDGGFDEPPTNEEFWIEKIVVRGVDLFPIVEADKRLLEEITELVKEYYND